MARILIVDDDPMIVDLVRDLLAMQNHFLDTANDGAQAVAKLSQAPFDLLIIDRNMPIMNGIQAIAAVRSNPQLRALKILMFTAVNDPSKLAEAAQVGADGCLNKPIQLAEFSATIRKVLEK